MLSYLDTAIGFAVVMLGVSLLITILTQMVSALVNHRGGNLLWGITTLFANIDPARYPNLTAQSDSIARLVLTHRLVSDSWFSNNRVAMGIASKFPVLGKLFARFQIASAIRPVELTDILRHLSANTLAGQPVAAEIRTLLGSAASATASQRASRAASAVAGAPAAGTPGTAAVPVIQSAVDAVRDTAGRLEDWFNSMMDRVSQKFAMYMRLWTVVFACAFAFGTGLNAPQLLIDLYSNGAVREQLVSTAAPLAETAQSLLAGNPATTPDAIQNPLTVTYTGALEQALKEANVQTAQSAPEHSHYRDLEDSGFKATLLTPRKTPPCSRTSKPIPRPPPENSCRTAQRTRPPSRACYSPGWTRSRFAGIKYDSPGNTFGAWGSRPDC